jgi:hypothetical protein
VQGQAAGVNHSREKRVTRARNEEKLGRVAGVLSPTLVQTQRMNQ